MTYLNKKNLIILAICASLIYNYTFSMKDETYFFYAMKDDGIYAQQVSPGYFQEAKIQNLTASNKKLFFRIDEDNIGFFDKPALKRYDIRNNQVYTICPDSHIQDSVQNSDIVILYTTKTSIFYKNKNNDNIFMANLTNSSCQRTNRTVNVPYKSSLCNFKSLYDDQRAVAYGNSQTRLVSNSLHSEISVYAPQNYSDTTSLVSDNSVVVCDEHEDYVRVYTITSYGIFARKIVKAGRDQIVITEMESISSFLENEQNIKAAVVINDNMYIYSTTGLYFIDVKSGSSTTVTQTRQSVESVFYLSKYGGMPLSLGKAGHFELVHSVRAEENSQTEIRHTTQLTYGIETKTGKTTTDMTETGFKVEAKIKVKKIFGFLGVEVGASMLKSTTETTSIGTNEADQSAKITTFNITTPANTNSFTWQYVGDGRGQFESLDLPTLFFVDTESNVPPTIQDIQSQFQ